MSDLILERAKILNAWGAIQYVSTALSLVAFIAACVLFAYRSQLKAKRKEIELAPSEDRLRAIGAAAKWLGVNIQDVPEDQRAPLILEQIKQRSKRDVILALLSFGIALIVGAIAIY